MSRVDTVLQAQATGAAASRRRVVADVERAARFAGLPAARCEDLRIALIEVLTNALVHGHDGDVDEPIEVRVLRDRGHLDVEVRDRALGATRPPATASRPDVRAQAAGRQPVGGLGLPLLRATVDDATWRAADGHTVVRLRCALPTHAG